MLSLEFAVVFLPLVGFLIAGLLGYRLGKHGAEYVTTGLMIIAALISCLLFNTYALHDGEKTVQLMRWFSVGTLEVNWALRFDALTAVMLIVVNIVSCMVHIYSIGYMAHDEFRPRFFAFLSLFTFAMLMLVTSDNLVQMFFGWEGVGLASYLLINFWFKKPSANAASIKAFLVNRVGDFGFALGIMGIYMIFGSVQFGEIFTGLGAATHFNLFGYQVDALTVSCLLLFMGAMGKSAQLGLHTWLPDAMEGPTPVSALIHAATMVTAGVYVVVRNHAIFDLSPFGMSMVAFVGGGTALFAATIGLVQTDIKRVLAYSTVSQLGYMFLGCGIGAYTAAVFHVMTHAFFKALLFLAAGSVIHALSGEQDIRKMGGLSTRIPWTHRLFLIGTIAIAGLPPLAGFWSKDEIMAHAFTNQHYLLYGMAAFGALMTSFYMFRLTYLTFYGSSRMDPHTAEHVHESPMIMVAPLMVLGFLSIVGGLILGFPPEHGWLHGFLRPVVEAGGAHEASAGMVFLLMGIAIVIALAGWGLAHFLYGLSPATADRWAARFSRMYRLLLNKYYIDELYDLIFVEPLKRLGAMLDWFDRTIIDGIVRGVGWLADWGSMGSTWVEKYIIYGGLNVIGYSNHLAAREGRKMQSGMVHHYAAIIVAGIFLLVLVVQLFAQM